MKGNILIVEDDPVARNALAEIIQAQGYVTSSVSTVAEAVKSLDGQDCALIDMDLPDGLGTYILRRIRDERRPIRAAVLSGTSSEPLLRWAVRYGAEVVMRKPLVVDQLLDWLARPHAPPTPTELQPV